MQWVDSINKYIISQVKAGTIDKAVAVHLLSEFNSKDINKSSDIAIIGMACRFPDAENPDEFWNNIVNKKCSIRSFPEQRLKDTMPAFSVNGQQRKDIFFQAGFIEGIDKFDADFFRLSPREATLMDPYQRLILEAAVNAIEDAGYPLEKIRHTQTGVYIGTDHTHKLKVSYTNLVDNFDPDMLDITGSSSGILAGRLSYILDLTGPCIVTDTACSSGLVALHQACRSLRDNECSLALVGGINIFLYPLATGKLSDIESNQDGIRAFDQYASGTVWGEGVAVLMLKPLKKALIDRDNIQAIIKGSAINNDGASNGITAPSAEAQRKVLVQAWKNAEIDPETLSYIEAHGTGTLLGDPIEVKGMSDAFAEFTDRKQFCGIGSIKSNIGHTVGVSGLASLIKVVGALKHNQMPPNINFQEPNRYIDFSNSPLYFNDTLKNWDNGNHPRRAGVTALGFSGTNCHIVLQESPSRQITVESYDQPRIFCLSAKTEAQLKKLIAKYKSFLVEQPQVTLSDICYTLSLGRTHFRVRIACVVEDRDALIRKVNVWHQKETLDIKTNSSKALSDDADVKNMINEYLSKGKSDIRLLQDTADLYESGADIPWAKLYDEGSGKKTSLPTYPFAGNRYWVNISHLDLEPRLISDSKGFHGVNEISTVQLMGRENDQYSEREQEIADIWGYALGIEEIDVTGDFYEMGGDSILAMKIINIIRQKIDLEIQVSDLLSYPNVAALVDCIEEKMKDMTESIWRQYEIKSIVKNDHYPVSSAQKRIFILNCLEGDDIRYNLPLAVKLDGPLNRDQVEKTFLDIIGRHEVLRTSFEILDGGPIQKVHESSNFKLEYWDAVESDVSKILKTFIRPFELTRPLLIRGGLIRLENQRHVLLMDMHHIISDGTSMGVLMNEFVSLYNGRDLPELKIQYKDFSAWQNQFLQSSAIKKQQQYWMTRLKGVDVLNLTTDYPRPAVQQFEGKKICFSVDAELSEKLHNLAKETQSTLFMVILAVFNIMLYKYTGQEDITVGSPIAGRNHPDLDPMIGVFLNTLVHRNFPKSDITFTQFLAEVRDHALKAYDNQDVPFERLLEGLNLSRDLSRNPLFDVMLLIQPMETPTFEVDELTFGPYPIEHTTSKFDLTLQAIFQKETLLFDIEYSTALFKEGTIKRMAGHLLEIFRLITTQPDIKVRDISMLSVHELKQIYSDFNNTYREYDQSETYGALFAKQVTQTPDKTALVFKDQKLTYKQLDERSQTLACRLIKEGVMPDDRVAIMAHRSLEMIVAIIAILKSGGAYVPIDPTYPPQRIQWVLEDCEATVLLADELPGGEQRFSCSILLLNDKKLYTFNDSFIDVKINSKNLAYVTYTSGSTGRPKGVMISHQALHNFIVAMSDIIDFLPDKRICALTTISFDIFVLETLLPLTKGVCVFIADEETQTSADKLEAMIIDHNINLFQSTPSRFKMLMDGCPDLSFMSSLETILIGGEPFPEDLLNRLKDHTNAKILNMYGPTETTVWSSFSELNATRNITIGRPIANTQIYIVNKDDGLCPVGVTGELCIAGDGLARGYLNKHELTSQRFVNNPLLKDESKISRGLMYKTGDMACWLDDGSIEFLGRIDNQVKLRGFRIEPGEIELSLNKHDSVKESVVVKRTDADGHDYLSAFVVADKNITVVELRDHLNMILPDYMIPARFTQLKQFPLTDNGKVNRKALNEDMSIEIGVTYSKPVNDEEQALAMSLSKVLGVKRVGRNDNYFALGGDSIKAIQVVSRLKSHHYQLDVRDLFQYQTVKAVSQRIKPLVAPIDNRIVEGSAPLMPFQHWLFDNEHGQLHHYNLSFMLFRNDGFEEDIIQTAFNKIVEHHDALRMVFIVQPQEITQLNRGLKDYAFELKVIDLTADDEYEQIIKEEADKLQASLNTEQGPLLKLGLFKTKEGDHLLIIIHQLIIDHVSWRILFEDFNTAYEQAIKKEDIVLPDKTKAYISAVISLQSSVNQLDLSEDIAYWKKVESLKVPSLSKDFLSGDNLAKHTKYVYTDCLNEQETQQLLTSVNRNHMSELTAILLHALGLMFYDWTGHDKIRINMGGHGREAIFNEIDISRTIGRFTTLFPFILTTSRLDNMDMQLTHIINELDRIPNNGASYGLLKSLVNRDRLKGLTFNTFPEIAFSYMGQFDMDVTKEMFSASSMPVGDMIHPDISRSYALNIITMVAWGKLIVRFDYSVNQYKEGTVNYLGQRFSYYCRKIFRLFNKPH